MSNRRQPQINALRSLGDEFRRLATEPAGRRAPVGRPHARLAVGLAVSLAIALAFFSLTPPGRAIAERFGELVGIGDTATLSPQPQHGLTQRDPGIVIASGRAPDGTPYEAVVNRSRLERNQVPVSCISLDLPNSRPIRSGEECVELEGGNSEQGDPIDWVNFIDRASAEHRSAQFGGEARYALTAGVNPEVDAVRVTYAGRDGKPHRAFADLGQLDQRTRERIGTDPRPGLLVAFLPDDGLAPAAGISGPGHRRFAGVLGGVELVALDADGDEIGRNRFGRWISSLYARQRNREAEASRVRAEVKEAIAGGGLGVRLCLRAIRFGVAKQRCRRVLARNAHHGARPRAVIAAGRSPSGTAYLVRVSKGIAGHLAPQGHAPTCITLVFPRLGAERSTGSLCPGRELREDVREDAVFPLLSLGPRGLGKVRLLLTGLASPRVSRIEVRYPRSPGSDVIVNARLLRVGAKQARRIGGPEGLAYVLAFLPEGLVPHPQATIDPARPPSWLGSAEQKAALRAALDRIEVRAYDSSGALITRLHLGQVGASALNLYPVKHPSSR